MKEKLSYQLQFIIYSLIGIIFFFIPITVNGSTSIPLDYVVTLFQQHLATLTKVLILIVIICGGILPFIQKDWQKGKIATSFIFFKVLGAVIGILLFFKIGPDWFVSEKTGLYLYDYLVVPVGLTVPIGAAFLTFLVSYGLFEFVGVFTQRIMKPVWHVPGRAAVNALASFVASFAVGLLITDKEYREGKYNHKEAVIIATGFSTVTVAFMVVIAKTLDLMSHWNLYFFVTLFVTFVVTAITTRIPPISRMSTDYYDTPEIEEDLSDLTFKSKVSLAWTRGLTTVKEAPHLFKNVWQNFKEGVLMSMSILPTILSIGLIFMLIAEYTPVFNYGAYVFYPLTALLQIPEPFLAAKGTAIGITEMFLPSLIVIGAPLVTKFIIAVVSVSTIIFFSASVPSMLSTHIPLKIQDLVIIWFERSVLSLIIVTPLAFLFLG
ncbi:histidine transporter [Staphylococcus microti]|uniref:Histidine transporter n=1 Tax=Staphylococcus microti TaxID=569857 RepID=A0A0D6XUC6_9STAP|nr:YjiH family protein [Staphylococcus microti]KIX91851.1 histidine transporter [Staphylococcus microti]PNZ84049.1 histidine transporter [Staphylococcus microti]SUM56481.1 membrane spanning protein [Staphylococcus microti]